MLKENTAWLHLNEVYQILQTAPCFAYRTNAITKSNIMRASAAAMLMGMMQSVVDGEHGGSHVTFTDGSIHSFGF